MSFDIKLERTIGGLFLENLRLEEVTQQAGTKIVELETQLKAAQSRIAELEAYLQTPSPTA